MHAGGRFGATSCVRRCLVYRRYRASSCRRTNPIEPGWRRQRLLEVFLAGAAIWRTGCHRRTLLICLHACAGRHSAQPNLRHIESRPRLPCPCGGGFPNPSNIPQSRCNTCSRRCLSSERPSMDQAEWRFDTKTYLSSRPSTRGIISALLATSARDCGHWRQSWLRLNRIATQNLLPVRVAANQSTLGQRRERSLRSMTF
jgi:hypothetical protein